MMGIDNTNTAPAPPPTAGRPTAPAAPAAAAGFSAEHVGQHGGDGDRNGHDEHPALLRQRALAIVKPD